ncbi:MAG: hypothetical protein HY961_08590 [Ignavibacteriae bacterium]|nr:hypothetical protein [Ignavibacteriota bacterium]
MKKIFGFGEEVRGFSIPVLNEREIRAAAGLLFLALIVSSTVQALVVVGFVAYIFLAVIFFNDTLNEKPFDLFGISASAQSK